LYVIIRDRALSCVIQALDLLTEEEASTRRLILQINLVNSRVKLREITKANCGPKKRVISKHEVRSESIQMWENKIAQYTFVRAFYRAK
jgi:hypothetical protein